MNIILHDATDSRMKDTFIIEYEGQCGPKAYSRKITKEPNEEGKWQRLINEIEKIAQTYGVELEKALEVFQQVSCCKKQLKIALENEDYVMWTKQDDQAIRNPDSLEYRLLLKTRGLAEIQRRKKFLGEDEEVHEIVQ